MDEPKPVTYVIEVYGECLNFKKNYSSKRHSAINPPLKSPLGFEHLPAIVLLTV